jgi:hypothetical protein
MDEWMLPFIEHAQLTFCSLETCTCAGNVIRHVPSSLLKMERLEVLDLSNNRIAWLCRDALSRLPSVKSVDLSSNRITLIPSSISQLNQAVSLKLERNPIVAHLGATATATAGDEEGGEGRAERGGGDVWWEARRLLREAGGLRDRLRAIVGETGGGGAKEGDGAGVPRSIDLDGKRDGQCEVKGEGVGVVGRLLGVLMLSQAGWDCEIVSGIDGGRIGAHSSVLMCRANALHSRLHYKALSSPSSNGGKATVTRWSCVVEESSTTISQLLWWIYTDTMPEEHKGPLLTSASSCNASKSVYGPGGELRVTPITAVGAHELGLLAGRLGLPRLAAMCSSLTCKASTMFSRVLLRSYDLNDQVRASNSLGGRLRPRVGCKYRQLRCGACSFEF